MDIQTDAVIRPFCIAPAQIQPRSNAVHCSDSMSGIGQTRIRPARIMKFLRYIFDCYGQSPFEQLS